MREIWVILEFKATVSNFSCGSVWVSVREVGQVLHICFFDKRHHPSQIIDHEHLNVTSFTHWCVRFYTPRHCFAWVTCDFVLLCFISVCLWSSAATANGSALLFSVTTDAVKSSVSLESLANSSTKQFSQINFKAENILLSASNEGSHSDMILFYQPSFS